LAREGLDSAKTALANYRFTALAVLAVFVVLYLAFR
jgi:hypothetical protein